MVGGGNHLCSVCAGVVVSNVRDFLCLRLGAGGGVKGVCGGLTPMVGAVGVGLCCE